MTIPYITPNEPHRFYARTVFDRIEKLYEDAVKDAADDEDVVIIIPLLNGEQIAMQTMGFQNPCFIVIGGIDQSGDKVAVLLSHTNIQVIIKTVKRQPAQRKSVLGFIGQIDSLGTVISEE